MSQQSYEQSISVNATPAEVFEALTKGYDHWWTTTQGQQFNQVGDAIKFTFPPNISYWTLAAKELVPNERVTLECVAAHHIIEGKPEASHEEWLGTTMNWSIEANGKATMVHFTHNGLIPELHCYDVCKAGWDMFFVGSLKDYLNTGVGSPHTEVNQP